MRFVIDTNILISALIRDSTTRKIIKDVVWDFYYPEKSFVEVCKYKSLILKKSKMNEQEYTKLLDNLLEHITLVSDEFMQQGLSKATNLLCKIDPDDVIFLACAIALDLDIWSDDKHFQKQNRVGVFTTNEFVKRFLK